MKLARILIAATGVLAFFPVTALPQALPNLASTRLNYNVRKRTTKLEGDLKAKIDQVDRDLAEATRLGQVGEVRRQMAKGMTLMGGNPWTDALDFSNSLVLRAEAVFVDTSRPYAVRLEQIYGPSIALEHALTAKVTLRKPRAGQGGGRGAAAQSQPEEPAKSLGSFDEVGRDLREAPFFMDLDLAGVADGVYQLQVEVLDGTRSLGSASLRIATQKGLATSLSRIEAAAASAPESFRNDALYPIDHIRQVNRGLMDIGQFDVAKELAGSEEVLAAAKSGKDPFAGRTGDFKRHYLLKSAGEIMPYRVYVPKDYDGTRPFPLVVALHGLGGTEDSMFGQNYRVIEQAEPRGYIVVAPLGYRVDGGYGRANTRQGQLSEQDAMEVYKLARQQYKIDENRIYLLGHSMGGFGTWVLGAKYANIWAALAPISGGGTASMAEQTRKIPQVVVHGDADTVVLVSSSRTMVEELKKLGAEVKYIEVPGGSHGSVAAPSMSAIFDFFDAHRKPATTAAR